jgi:hypothetical protein
MAESYEGRQSGDTLKAVTEIAKTGIGAWVDTEISEESRGETTGRRVQKGGQGGPVTKRPETGQVTTSAQVNGTAVDTASVNSVPTEYWVGAVVLAAAIAFVAYEAADG